MADGDGVPVGRQALALLVAALALGGCVVGGGDAKEKDLFLQRAESALDGLAGSCRAAVDAGGLQPVDRYVAFIDVLDRDAQSALSAVRLVLAQPSIGSQLIDNLNASIHVRALLTDLFLIDEILKTRARVL